MGSAESKNNNEEEEALSHFKHRIQFIKLAISTRKAFSAALSAYSVCLKNTGAALTDGAPSTVDFLPPPPPPLPHPRPLPPPPHLPYFSPGPLQRAIPMPKMKLKTVVPTVIEAESELENGQFTTNSSSSSGAVQVEQKLKDWDYFFGTDDVGVRGEVRKTVDFAMPVRPPVKKGGGEIGRKARQPVSLKQVFLDVDDHFLKAFESTLEVTRMLEATTLHYHSNLSDNRADGLVDPRISGLISRDQSFKETQGEADQNKKEIEALATVLDKMLAWENKLYGEANAGEVIKYEHQKTVSLVDKLKKQGSNTKSLVKLNTAISHLHSRYIVEMQSAVSTIAEINCTRDYQLYPVLVQLVDGMARMWNTMQFHHESQAKIVYSLKSIDNSQFQKETNEYHYDCTIQLCGAVRDWHTQFCGLIGYQKDFISALHNWSKLSLEPFESNLEEKVSSPPTVQNAQIHALLIAWKNDLDSLPDEVARNALRNLAALIQTIVHQQEEDVKTRGRSKATQKERDYKSTQFQDSCIKNGGNEELNRDNPVKDAKEEKESVTISPKQQLEVDEEACQKDRKAARLASLRYSLVEVFSAMSEIAKACKDMYYNLKRIEDQHRISCMSNPIIAELTIGKKDGCVV